MFLEEILSRLGRNEPGARLGVRWQGEPRQGAAELRAARAAVLPQERPPRPVGRLWYAGNSSPTQTALMIRDSVG